MKSCNYGHGCTIKKHSPPRVNYPSPSSSRVTTYYAIVIYYTTLALLLSGLLYHHSVLFTLYNYFSYLPSHTIVLYSIHFTFLRTTIILLYLLTILTALYSPYPIMPLTCFCLPASDICRVACYISCSILACLYCHLRYTSSFYSIFRLLYSITSFNWVYYYQHRQYIVFTYLDCTAFNY